MQIEELAHHPSLGPTLARWHVDEWEHLYQGWDLPTAVAEFAAMDTPGRVPTTYVAFDGDGRSIDDVLGSVSLIDDDDLPGWRDVGPWFASLYVVPRARGRGLGRQLTQLAVDRARDLGIDTLHLFTSGQEEFYAALGWRVVARTPAGDATATVMARSTSPRGARRALVTHWCGDPDVATAYSYLRPGGTPADRDTLARPLAPGLALAGEATWRDHPGTAHGAWFSGERAAARVLADGATVGRAVVVGAGLAGVAAAQAFRRAGVPVVVLEAGDQLGGRARSDRSLGGPVNLGAAWMHGTEGHPLADAAAALGVEGEPSVWDRVGARVVGTGRVADAVVHSALRRHGALETALATEVERGDEGAALGPVVRRLLADVGDGAATDETLVLQTMVRAEFENLYAAPLDDLSLVHCQEPFRLPGPDVLVLGAIGDLVAHLADGLDVRCGARVAAVVRDSNAWRVELDGGATELADAVVVTVPIGALQAGRVRFDPPLPADVTAAMGRIGAGRVAKVFATFDEVFWAPDAAFHVCADPPAALSLWVDTTPTAGRPTLCAFATGDAAVAIEALDEDALCRLVDGTLASVFPA